MKKKIFSILMLMIAMLGICAGLIVSNNNSLVSHASASSSPVINWGLKHNSNEKAPTAPEDGVHLLEQHNGMFLGPCDGKEVYLTFDLGYEAGHTDSVLDVLKENNIKAIFFLCGNYLQEDELINRMIDEGHTIGNHTYHHKDLPTLGHEKMKEDITSLGIKFNEKFGERYSKPLTHFRPPKGRFNEEVLKTVADEGMKTIMWSSAIVDWGKAPIDAEASAKKITGRIHPGAIVLLHITNSGTPEMLEKLIPMIQEKGYTFGNSGTL